ncbi:MAG: RusA family crossover junction endodeoxyribonuclease [Endomicrobium sp.]|jgi:Holliday junction resolvase RusA-like endonuclease|nr:RusA family crossover junction endodeoxyribonuclease [Endomicrobium sp.]
MIINIPVKPISANDCWKGRHFPTRKYEEFKKEVDCHFFGKKRNYGNVNRYVYIKYVFYLVNFCRRDVDNCVKPLQDCLVRNGIICDDRYILGFSARKIKSKEDKVEIAIYQITEEELICFSEDKSEVGLKK